MKIFSAISLDNKVRGKLLAEEVSPLVRCYAPNAKLGLISGYDYQFRYFDSGTGLEWRVVKSVLRFQPWQSELHRIH